MERNGYEIKYSEIYERFQVWASNDRCLEEFDNIEDAIEFADQN